MEILGDAAGYPGLFREAWVVSGRCHEFTLSFAGAWHCLILQQLADKLID